MKRYFPIFNLMLIFGLAILVHLSLGLMDLSALAQGKRSGEAFKLPPPRYESEVSIEKALLERRSVRSYKEEPLTLNDLSQILWAAQGHHGTQERFEDNSIGKGPFLNRGVRASRKCDESSDGYL